MDENVKTQTEEKTETEQEIALSDMTKDQLIALVEYYKIKSGAADEKELETAKAAAEDYKDKWMRLAAEFENYKKRNAKLRIESLQEGRGETVVKILPIGDNLDRALKMNIDENTLSGLQMLKKNFDDVLQAIGATEIAKAGEKFDPNFQEAVMQVPAESEELDDVIAEVYTKGYKLGDRVIRYAQVSVYKA